MPNTSLVGNKSVPLHAIVQPAVDGVQHAVQQQVSSALSSSATELTRNNSALAGMVSQLEMLAGGAALREGHGGGGRECAQPCLDLRQYPALHSQACICAVQAFARMQALAEQVASLSTWAVMGERPLFTNVAAPTSTSDRGSPDESFTSWRSHAGWSLQLVCCMLNLAISSHWLGRTTHWNTTGHDPAVGVATYQRLETESSAVETGECKRLKAVLMCRFYIFCKYRSFVLGCENTVVMSSADLSHTTGVQSCSKGDMKSAEVELRDLKSIDIMCTVSK